MGEQDDERVSALRATAHPVRLQMLSLLTGTAMSAAEVARELGLTHANASYHLRRLVAADQLVEAGEETIRGGVAKRYRYPHERPVERPGSSRRSVEDQTAYARALGHELERRVRDRAGHGQARGRSSDLEGWVPPEVWQRVLDLYDEASTLLHDHNAPPRTPGTLHVSATSWAFRMSQPDSPEDDS